MESRVQKAIDFEYKPIAIILSNSKPEKAKQFKEGNWGCVMFMLAAAAKGGTAVFDRKTFGCFGGGTGLGFGNQYTNFPGGEDCFNYFLSVGNDQWEKGREAAKQVKTFLRDDSFNNFVHGERYIKSPELVKKFVKNLPTTNIPYEYVIFKPLEEVDQEKETPEVVVFLGNMDQIAALTILTNYARETNDNVIYPYAAGCMSLAIYPFQEAKSKNPKAVLGLNDISARLFLKRMLKTDLTSFAVPLKLFQEMEENVDGSFLEQHTWRDLLQLSV